jgi:DNA mismatch repair protein MLH1
MPTRRGAMRSGSEEHARIADIVTKYAIHNAGVSFTLKKQTETVADVRTNSSASVVDNIRTLYGANIARELLAVDIHDSKLSFQLHGQVTNANFSTKKCIFLLFINHRLVDCTALRRAVDTIYAAYLPKNSHPFVYMSLEVAPANIDVNVHPTKREVHFLHEDSIIESIQRGVEQRLLGCNTSRTYSQQLLLPGASQPLTLDTESEKRPGRIYDRHLVRTDAHEQTLEAFLPLPGIVQEEDKTEVGGHNRGTEEIESVEEIENVEETIEQKGTAQAHCEELMSLDDDNQQQDPVLTKSALKPGDKLLSRKRPLGTNDDVSNMKLTGLNQPHRRIIRLTSVLNLRQIAVDSEHTGLREMFQNYKFVGCCTESLALIQYRTKLFIVNFTRLRLACMSDVALIPCNFPYISFLHCHIHLK